MILPFSTQINGKPNYFVESIWEGLLRNIFEEDKEYDEYLRLHKNKFGTYWDWFPNDHERLENPKIHTIREDKNNRWKPGNDIHFVINNRTKKSFQFAPVLPVVSVQRISIKHENTYTHKKTATIEIDGNWFAAYNFNQNNIYGKLELLIKNDGFNSVEDFFNYFNEDFDGKIIHWTNFKY